MVNHNKRKHNEPIRTRGQYTSQAQSAGKRLWSRDWFWFCIWLVEYSVCTCSASFLNQSQSVVQQNQSSSGLLSTLNWKPLYTMRIDCGLLVLVCHWKRNPKNRYMVWYNHNSQRMKVDAIALTENLFRSLLLFWLVYFVNYFQFIFVLCKNTFLLYLDKIRRIQREESKEILLKLFSRFR